MQSLRGVQRVLNLRVRNERRVLEQTRNDLGLLKGDARELVDRIARIPRRVRLIEPQLSKRRDLFDLRANCWVYCFFR